jgi:hypothetical protein
MPNFSKTDVKIVCEAIIERAIQLDESGRNVLIYCTYCLKDAYYTQGSDKIQHINNCAYLVAKDLITGL